MIANVFRNYWPHIFLWAVMFVYFIFAPDFYTLALTKNGKPLQIDTMIPAESDRIKFVVEDLVPYVKDGQSLYQLYGRAFITLPLFEVDNSFTREIVLISDKKIYFFSAKSSYRNPGYTNSKVDLSTLGFSALIEEDTIKPGKYRIGIAFRNASTGSAFYYDKPVYYLIKTPNTIRFNKN